MTREEAKEELIQSLTDNHIPDHEAVEMAIKALEQKQCDVFDEYGNYKYPSDIELTEPNTTTSMPYGTCEHSDEINGSNCYECIKGIRDRYNPQPCENAIGRSDMLDAIGHGTTYTSEDLQRIIKALPPVNPQQKSEDIAKAFQFGLALGFGKRYDEMDRVIDEIKKVITPQTT